jgi:pentose-5-phosphate-3-epimerase
MNNEGENKQSDEYVEVKVHRDGVSLATARKIIKQGVKLVVAGSPISKKAKILFDQNGVSYFENVEPEDLEIDSEEENE